MLRLGLSPRASWPLPAAWAGAAYQKERCCSSGNAILVMGLLECLREVWCIHGLACCSELPAEGDPPRGRGAEQSVGRWEQGRGLCFSADTRPVSSHHRHQRLSLRYPHVWHPLLHSEHAGCQGQQVQSLPSGNPIFLTLLGFLVLPLALNSPLAESGAALSLPVPSGLWLLGGAHLHWFLITPDFAVAQGRSVGWPGSSS